MIFGQYPIVRYLLTKIVIVLFGILTISCNQKGRLDGMWVSIPNNEFNEMRIVHFVNDTIIAFPPNSPFPFRATFSWDGQLLKVNEPKDFYERNIPFKKKLQKDLWLTNDTLNWGTDYQLVRTPHNSFLKHFANSKGLKIVLYVTNSSAVNIYSDDFKGIPCYRPPFNIVEIE